MQLFAEDGKSYNRNITSHLDFLSNGVLSSVIPFRYQNILVPGMTLKTGGDGEGQLHCAVTFNKRLHLLDSYQVMTDRAGTSRLEWRHWDQFTKMPVGKSE